MKRINNENIITELVLVISDLESRELGNNCQSYLTWDQLCDLGISLFELLRRKESGLAEKQCEEKSYDERTEMYSRFIHSTTTNRE